MYRKDSWWKLFGYCFNFVSISFINIFLITISFITGGVVLTSLIIASSDPTKFLINFQYYVIIFYGIIVFIFVLMNSIKIFGTSYNDGTFLLLMAKPYSRKTIILTQCLSLYTVELLFIFTNIFLLLVISLSLSIFIKISYLTFLVMMLLKLFIFSIAFSFLLTNGIIFFLSFNKIQNVFLIFIIFCSLFLLGGLPYNLIKNIDDNITLTFNNTNKFSEKTIKDTLLFKDKLNKGLIKYPDITKTIYNFYNDMSLTELNDINKDSVIQKRLKFYNSLGLMETVQNNKIKTASGHVKNWTADYGKPDYTGKDITIHINFNSYVINLYELEARVGTNNNFRDLYRLINDYNSQFKQDTNTSGMKYFMDYQKNLAPDLLTYDLDSSQTYIVEADKPSDKNQVNAQLLNSLFLGSVNYNISGNLQVNYNKIFDNPVYFALRSVENNVYHQVYNYKIITTTKVNVDKNFIKLYDNQQFYTILNYVNVIEQWNQMWTSFSGCYNDYWFNPLATSSIDFASQNNILFSYPDIKINLSKNNAIDKKLDYYQNSKILIIVYLVISFSLLILTILCFYLKTII